jgi:phage baseplate assembly protein V
VIDRATFDALGRLLKPLRARVANVVARAVVQLVDDSTMQQLVQLGVMAGEDIDDCENFHPYGFTSVPLPGAEAVVLFPNGDRGHPLVVAVSDRRHRPTGGEPGEVSLYTSAGSRVRLLADGNVEVQPGPGGEVFVRSEGGTADRLVKLSEFNAHTHAPGSLVAAGPLAITGVSAAPVAATGTQKLQAE